MYPQETRIHIAVLSGLIVLIVLIIFFVINITRYQRKKVADHKKNIRAEFNNLDKERERIAIELHDDLGGTLSAIKMQLQAMMDLSPANTKIVTGAEHFIDEVMAKLRSYAFNLMPGVLQRKGLDEALRDLIDLIAHATKIKIEYKFVVPACNKETATHIYMMIQEILNNTVKHSKATLIKLSVFKKPKIIEIHVCDNGIGFDKASITKNSPGIGIHNILSRADLLNATIFLTSQPGNGVDYLIKIPDV